MGKDYFEFLEEEFQGLASQLQKLLAEVDGGSTTLGSNNDSEQKQRQIKLQWTRCQAIFQQMKQEIKDDTDFQERFELYAIQLQTLATYYRSNVQKEELVFAIMNPQDNPSTKKNWLSPLLGKWY